MYYVRTQIYSAGLTFAIMPLCKFYLSREPKVSLPILATISRFKILLLARLELFKGSKSSKLKLRQFGKHKRVWQHCREKSSVPQPPDNAGRGDERGRAGGRGRTGRRGRAGVTCAAVLVELLPDLRRELERNLRYDGDI